MSRTCSDLIQVLQVLLDGPAHQDEDEGEDDEDGGDECWEHVEFDENEGEPCDESVEEDERDNWQDYVEDGGQPQHVDVQVPKSMVWYDDTGYFFTCTP